MTNSSSAAPAAEELLRERDRVVRRLGSMALDALPAERVHAAAQQLADLASEAAGDPRRTVPVLAPHAAADQITVLVAELQAAAPAHPGRSDLLTEAAHVLTELRRDLP